MVTELYGRVNRDRIYGGEKRRGNNGKVLEYCQNDVLRSQAETGERSNSVIRVPNLIGTLIT